MQPFRGFYQTPSCRCPVELQSRTWQRNEGESFWACLTTDYRIDISTTKTVEDLVDRGQFFTRRLLRSRPRDDPKSKLKTQICSSCPKMGEVNCRLLYSRLVMLIDDASLCRRQRPKKRKLPTMDGISLSGDRNEGEGLVVCCYGWMSNGAHVANKVAFFLYTFVCQEVTIFNSPVRSLRHTIDGGSYPSSPEDSSCSPPSPPDFNKVVEDEAQAFFSAAGSLQDILFSSLQDGSSLPAWAKDHPLYQFKLRLREEWGSRVK